MSNSEHLMAKEELKYFIDSFGENQRNGSINFDNFCNICRSYNKT